ncbi:hypothetical protein CAPTEDRAFT_225147 [Capitella teleta]|uniref:Uncharacterized protein n=1 Tax=Capitella teleta TaxID=283909 RepID=R7U888_CAPTE|nr:hypothetical protein CAPTEDRAFT_225147 [Capitella teleta]|eukprot:ELT99881.1 hypothetical protein CAPTEDRAFT_225147 [Capitella teleta]
MAYTSLAFILGDTGDDEDPRVIAAPKRSSWDGNCSNTKPRANFLQNKLSFFDSTFEVEGYESYDEEEQLQHMKRYAEHKTIDSAPFKFLLQEESVLDLCNNPLNLTLLCLLEDTQLMNTQTALYTAIHSIITRKAGEHLNLTPSEVEESLVRPLYQFAFEAHQKNKTVSGRRIPRMWGISNMFVKWVISPKNSQSAASRQKVSRCCCHGCHGDNAWVTFSQMSLNWKTCKVWRFKREAELKNTEKELINEIEILRFSFFEDRGQRGSFRVQNH